MRISVIIPTYNRANFVLEAVQSVLQQTVKPHEIIVVDDGSTDNTKHVLKPWIKNINYIHQNNKGVSAARNVGINTAKEEWLAFLDSDDLWKPKKIEKQVLAIQQNKQYQICYTNEEWRNNGQWKNPKKIHQKYAGWIYNKCLPLCIISPSSVLIHKDIFNKIGLFDEQLPACEDYDLWLRMSLQYPVLFLDERLIIKQAGDWDQLSKNHSLDKFRIIALIKILETKKLDTIKRYHTLLMLKTKSDIYRQGCEKHNKQKELQWIKNVDQFITRSAGKE